MLPQPVLGRLAAIVHGFLVEVAKAVEAALKVASTFPHFRDNRVAPDVPAPAEMLLEVVLPARAIVAAVVFAVGFRLDLRNLRVDLAAARLPSTLPRSSPSKRNPKPCASPRSSWGA